MKKGYIAAGILAIVATLALVLGLVLRSDDEFDKDSKDDEKYHTNCHRKGNGSMTVILVFEFFTGIELLEE